MKLIVLALVLLFWRLPSMRQFAANRQFFAVYLNYLSKYLGNKGWYQRGIGLIFTLLLIALIVSFINAILKVPLLQLVFQVGVVFWVVVRTSGYPLEKIAASTPNASNLAPKVPTFLWKINYFWVTPLFWYFFGGVFAIVFYALLFFLQQVDGYWRAQARIWLEFMAWIPARLLGLAYCLVGKMHAGLKAWGEFFALEASMNIFFLEVCAMASGMDKGAEEDTQMYSTLLRDALILLIGLYGLLAIISWFL